MSQFQIQNKVMEIDGHWYNGVGVYLTDKKCGDFIVTAVTTESLAKVMRQHFKTSLDVGKAMQLTLCGTTSTKEADVPEKITYWWYCDDTGVCLMAGEGFKQKGSIYIKIGTAVRETEIEAKILLRKYGLSKEEIENVGIPQDIIPF